MYTKELSENTYIEALLRAALLLCDPRSAPCVHEITISAIETDSCPHRAHPRCRILPENHSLPGISASHAPIHKMKRYLILYPMKKTGNS